MENNQVENNQEIKLDENKLDNKNNKDNIHLIRWKKILSFIIQTMNGMAYGLFATLIIGTIFKTIGEFFPDESFLKNAFNSLGVGLTYMTGLGIGIGIAWSMKFENLKLVCLGIAGGIAAYMTKPYGTKVGDPLTIYLVVIFTALLIKLVLRKKTPVDIILIPLFSCFVAGAITLLISSPVGYITTLIGKFVGIATEYQPFLMGIVIAVVVGMALTAPISSAAIAAMIFIATDATNANALAIAGGAAVVGCSCQMIGFAVMSRKDNNIGTIISIGIGTSMLEFKNILKKPIIWLPTIIASAILGPISTCLVKVQCLGVSAGMGTAGLVGQIGTFSTMGNTWQTWVGIFVLQIIAPIIIVLPIDLLFRKFGLIQKGDLTV